eukprot:334019-Amphidinium_carterae.1
MKATGKYNFVYMRAQDCRQLKIKKVKTRPTGFAAGAEEASSSGVPPAGEATGGPFPWANNVLSPNRRTGAVESGGTGSTGAGLEAPALQEPISSPFSGSDLASQIKHS